MICIQNTLHKNHFIVSIVTASHTASEVYKVERQYWALDYNKQMLSISLNYFRSAAPPSLRRPQKMLLWECTGAWTHSVDVECSILMEIVHCEELLCFRSYYEDRIQRCEGMWSPYFYWPGLIEQKRRYWVLYGWYHTVAHGKQTDPTGDKWMDERPQLQTHQQVHWHKT